jgi:flagellar biosynthetic protein FliQ
MTPDSVIELGQQAMEVTTLLAGMVLLPALLVGLVVAMFQAVTQINEMTLTFIPKLIAVAVVMAVAGPWMLNLLLDFATELIESIPALVG